MTAGLRLRVEVPVPPDPGLLRPALERRLAGEVWPTAPEDAVGRAVADAVAAHEARSRPEERPAWR